MAFSASSCRSIRTLVLQTSCRWRATENIASVAARRTACVEGCLLFNTRPLALNRGLRRSSLRCWKCSTAAHRLMRVHQRGAGGLAGERATQARRQRQWYGNQWFIFSSERLACVLLAWSFTHPHRHLRMKIMSTSPNRGADSVDFVTRVKRDFARAFRVLKETRTLSATYTFQAYVRVPGEAKVVAVHAPDAWADDQG